MIKRKKTRNETKQERQNDMYDGCEVVMKGGGEGEEGNVLSAKYFAIAFKSVTELSTSLG